MRNRISCSAQQLSQLEPDMVKSVVGGHVYKLGSQYLSESRVRIVDAHEGQINSEVDGTYGVYSQTIRLKSGTLTTKCSCPANEQPFCRHCVAVLENAREIELFDLERGEHFYLTARIMANGKNVSKLLLDKKFALPATDKAGKPSWCKE